MSALFSSLVGPQPLAFSSSTGGLRNQVPPTVAASAIAAAPTSAACQQQEREHASGVCLVASCALAATTAVAASRRQRRFAVARGRERARFGTTSRVVVRAGDGAVFSILVPIANDSEEIETACITDVLVRAGADVTVASVEEDLKVKMSRGLKIVADVKIDDCKDKAWDVIALPGGMPGAERLRDNATLTALLKAQKENGKLTAAVCASPAVVLATHGLLGDAATCYPADKFKEAVGDGWKDAKAVVDGNLITSQGPGTSLQFALKIVEELYGKAKAEELAAQMVTKIA